MFYTRGGSTVVAHRKHKSLDSAHIDTGSQLIDPQEVYNKLLSCKPDNISGSYDFKFEYLFNNILSKYTGLDDGDKTLRRDRAIEKMLSSEVICQEINDNGYRQHLLPMWFEGVMHHAREFVADVLGEFSYDCFSHARFSGGASTSRTRRHGDPYFKYNPNVGPVDVTPKCLPYGNALIKCTPLWSDVSKCKINITPGNRVTTVPKNSTIDRCIACEPDLNMSLQLAVGKSIRDKLMSFSVHDHSGRKYRGSINLNDQTLNQRLALTGSVHNSLATIDLSSASDTISYRLVMDLLPYPWFSTLDNLRSPIGELPDGSRIVWNKFSSMGNGFTFELETLIFAAIVHGVFLMNGKRSQFGRTSAVYGDDIICDSDIAHNVISALYSVGFTTNKDKTFVSGPFRESCGKHYYEGVDVTPFFIKGPLTNLTRVCWLGNRLRLWSYDHGTCDSSTYSIWKWIEKFVPRRFRGHNMIDETCALYSTHNPDQKLVERTISRRKMHGIPALLRAFQGMPVHDVNQYSVINNAVHIYRTIDDYAGGFLPVKDPTAFISIANKTLWSPKVMLYSEEIA